MIKKGGLGKGLDAIFMENESEDKNSTVTLKISEIEPNKDQPRTEFDDKALSELAESIALHGVLQPLLVRPLMYGGYQIVAGERRYRASRMAGLTEVPVVIKELDDNETVELAMIENLQREDLNPLEEALGYKYMMEKLGVTQEEAAQKVGKGRSTVTNALRLLKLPDEVLAMVESKKLSPGHARALLAFESEAQMIEVAKLIVSKGLSVREVEKMSKNTEKTPKPTKKAKRDTYFDEVEISISENTGRKVKVNEKTKKIEIEFFDKDDLAKIAKSLM